MEGGLCASAWVGQPEHWDSVMTACTPPHCDALTHHPHALPKRVLLTREKCECSGRGGTPEEGGGW
eukprot:2292180-Rhodomonas_salina.2